MKVGDYVRYKRPFDRKETIMIGKIIRIYEPDEKHKIKGYDLDSSDVISDEFSIKSSPNIIDLIELGDYVNGLKVDEIDEKGIYNYNSYDGWRSNIASCNDDIKLVVTKEQFSQIEYRIGE